VQHRDSESRPITIEQCDRAGGREAPPRSAAPPVLERSCGSCTLCCRVLEIQVLDKPAGILCRHNTGTGCGIYLERPEICARWHCLWRRIGALPAALRPDRSGVIFSLESRVPVADAPDAACIVARAVDGTQAFDRWEVIEAFAMFVRERSLQVWKAADGEATLLNPGPEIPAQ
jgi:hypothetical protein